MRMLAPVYYLLALAAAVMLLFSAALVSDGERAISRLDTPEEKTDTLVKDWLQTLSLGLYTGASDKAKARALLERDAGYHRGRVNLASAAIAGLSVLLLGVLAWRLYRREMHAGRRLALHLHGVAAVCLLVGLSAPMLTVVAQREVALLGNVVLQFETKSIVSMVHDLFAGGSVFIACLLALFSVIIPVAKLLVSLLALLSPHGVLRTRYVHFVRAIGKWSMTDVFVVAVLLAFLAGGKGAFTDARLGPGLYFFACYGLLSLLGGILLTRVINEPPRIV
jgi:paraquat-inducible protein A